MINLIHGDCLEKLKDIESGSIDAVICDPPYGTTACKWDSVIPFEPMWEQLHRVIKKNGAIVLFGSEPFSSALRMSNIKNYRYDWIWHKGMTTGFLNAKKMPLKITENIHLFYKTLPTYNPIMTQAKKEHIRHNFKECAISDNYQNKKSIHSSDYNGTLRYPNNLISINRGSAECHKTKIQHPTQKPIKLMEYLISTYTNENETVLDFTMGSGSTGCACVNLNRKFIGIEQDDKYFEIAKERINKQGEQLTLKV